MKKCNVSLLCASMLVSTLTSPLYGVTPVQQARQIVTNRMEQAKQKLRAIQKDINELSNCAIHGACSPEEQTALRKKLAIGAAAIGITIAALTAAITTAVVVGRRGKTPTTPTVDIPTEIPTEAIPFEQQPPKQQAVIEKGLDALYKAVLRSDEKEVTNILERLHQYKYPISGEPSQDFITPQGKMNLLTYATIALDQPIVEALLQGGITPNINEEVIKNSINSGFINPQDSTYIKIRELIKNAKKR